MHQHSFIVDQNASGQTNSRVHGQLRAWQASWAFSGGGIYVVIQTEDRLYAIFGISVLEETSTPSANAVKHFCREIRRRSRRQ